MLSERAADYARELRGWRAAGVLAALGDADLGDGVVLPLDVVAAIVLDDLDDLTDRARQGEAIGAERWQGLGDDLERVHRLVTAKLRP